MADRQGNSSVLSNYYLIYYKQILNLYPLYLILPRILPVVLPKPISVSINASLQFIIILPYPCNKVSMFCLEALACASIAIDAC